MSNRTAPSTTLVEARRTKGGTSVITFEGAPTIRTTKSYHYLVVQLRSSVLDNTVTYASIIKGTGSYATAEAAVRKYGGYAGVSVVVIVPQDPDTHGGLAYRVVLTG